MKKHNLSANLILLIWVIKRLYDKATNAVLFNGTVSTGGRTITKLCFADKWLSRRGRRTGNISWASWQSLHTLQHGDQCQEDQADDNTSSINTEIKVNGQKLETVTSFKYQGSVITDEGSKPELLCRIAQATAALTRLKPIWIYKGISLSSKIRLMRSLVTSIFLYACESWTLTAELQRRIQVMEMRCYRKILYITKTMLPTRKSVPRSSRQLDHTNTSWPS